MAKMIVYRVWPPVFRNLEVKTKQPTFNDLWHHYRGIEGGKP